MSKWISVHDMVPEQGVSVIVYPYNYDNCEDFSITGFYLDGKWYCERSIKIKPTHWRPLLDAPKEG